MKSINEIFSLLSLHKPNTAKPINRAIDAPKTKLRISALEMIVLFATLT